MEFFMQMLTNAFSILGESIKMGFLAYGGTIGVIFALKHTSILGNGHANGDCTDTFDDEGKIVRSGLTYYKDYGTGQEYIGSLFHGLIKREKVVKEDNFDELQPMSHKKH